MKDSAATDPAAEAKVTGRSRALLRARSRLMRSAAVPLLALALVGCTLDGLNSNVRDKPPTVSSLYALPSSVDDLADDHYFDHPVPSDFRLDQGKVVLSGFPTRTGILKSYVDAMDRALDGFSPAAAGLVRFSGPIDP